MFPRETPEARQARNEARKSANLTGLMAPARALVKGSYDGATSGVAVEKSEPHRNPALLEMARGRPCLLRIPYQCHGGVETVVACHSNLSEHGKAGARKADDEYSVWGCSACHRWLDASGAPLKAKEIRFTLAHLEQVVQWRRIAADPSEPARFRKAAQWALDMLNATPVGTQE